LTFNLAIEAVTLSVPSSWRVEQFRRLAALTSEQRGRRPFKLLSLSSDGVVAPRLEEGGLGRQAPAEQTIERYWVTSPGDLVVNPMWLIGGGVGVSKIRGAVSPDYRVYRLRPELHSRYAHYLLRSQPYRDQYRLHTRADTTFDRRVSKESFHSIPVLVPPIDEQYRIARFLDCEVTRIYELVKRKHQMMSLLDERFDSEIFSAVTRGLDPKTDLKRVASESEWVSEIPFHWAFPPVSAYYEVQLGKMLNGEASAGPEQFPYLRNTNVQWNRIELGELATMSFDDKDRKMYQLRPGDLLVCEGGEVGRAAVWDGRTDDCFFQKAIHRVRPRHMGNTRFMMYCLWAAAKRNVFAVEGNQSTIVHLTAEKLRVHRFPFPPLEEQEHIVEYLDGRNDKISLLRSALQRQLALLEERSQGLITAAVTGQLSISGTA